VTLEGTVRRELEREAATDTVRQVEGVVAVDNRIDLE
jgi:osmotically-inducible protein OsmY